MSGQKEDYQSYQNGDADEWATDDDNNNDSKPKSSSMFKVLAIFIAALAFIALSANASKQNFMQTGNTEMSLETSSYEINVEVTSPDYDALQSLDMLPWDAIAEPYREQTISVSSFYVDDKEIDLDTESYDVVWNIDGETYTGVSPTIKIEKAGVLTCTVSLTPSSTTGRRKLIASKSSSRRTKKAGILHKSMSRRLESSKDNMNVGKSGSAGKSANGPDISSLLGTDAPESSSSGSSGDTVLTTGTTTTATTGTTTTATTGTTTTATTGTTTTATTGTTTTGITDSSTTSTTPTDTTTVSISTPTDTTTTVISTPTDTTTTIISTPTDTTTTVMEEDEEVVVSDSYELEFTLAVKYVRREIRSMTDADREKYFDALYTMYTIDEVPGKALYGDNFNTAEYYGYKHLNGAGTTDCDHWHDGAGIVTHHMAFTLEVEQTLQAIDPSISMPYWEYGMDPYLYENWWESPIFDADWYGEANPSNDDHKIQDGGMWEGIAMPDGSDYLEWSIADTGTLNPFVNGYGYMRSPWNNNPSPYIGRHNQTYGMSQYATMPLCSTLQSCFKSTTMADMNDCLNGATHGPVHILIGGSWGQGSLFDDEDIQFAQMPDKLLLFKVLWRLGYTRCPDTCEFNQPCKCAVPDEYIEEYGAEEILTASNIIYVYSHDLEGADDELYLKTLRAVEDPGIAGEMFSSAASYDPTFWPLHGAAERLVDLKRILVSQGDVTDFDDSWAYTEYNKASGAAYLNGVCDWSKLAGSGDLTLPTCTMDAICFGHNENDLIEFSNFLGTGDAYTNIEFFEFMHPWNDDLPYVYDTFDYDYCDDQGYPFVAEYDDEVTDMVMDPNNGIPPSSSTGVSSSSLKQSSKQSSKETTGAKKSSNSATATPRKSSEIMSFKGYAPNQSAPKKNTRVVGDESGANVRQSISYGMEGYWAAKKSARRAAVESKDIEEVKATTLFRKALKSKSSSK